MTDQEHSIYNRLKPDNGNLKLILESEYNHLKSLDENIKQKIRVYGKISTLILPVEIIVKINESIKLLESLHDKKGEFENEYDKTLSELLQAHSIARQRNEQAEQQAIARKSCRTE